LSDQFQIWSDNMQLWSENVRCPTVISSTDPAVSPAEATVQTPQASSSQQGVESSHLQSLDPECCVGLPFGAGKSSSPTIPITNNCGIPGRVSADRDGDAEVATEESSGGGFSHHRPVHQPYVSDAEEGWHISACIQLEAPELFPGEASLQNGGLVLIERAGN